MLFTTSENRFSFFLASEHIKEREMTHFPMVYVKFFLNIGAIIRGHALKIFTFLFLKTLFVLKLKFSQKKYSITVHPKFF